MEYGVRSPNVVSTSDHARLYSSHDSIVVKSHLRTFQLISAAINSLFLCRWYAATDAIVGCTSVPEVWDVVRSWCLPLEEGETDLAVAKFERVSMNGDEDPKLFFARVSKSDEFLKQIGEPRTPEQIVCASLSASCRTSSTAPEAQTLGSSNQYRPSPRSRYCSGRPPVRGFEVR